jgi:hypothetical protein
VADRAIELFEEYVARVGRGEQPDVGEYLERAGDEREQLVALVDEFLATAPAREPSEDEVAMMRAWLERQPPLLALRTRRGLRRADVVGTLVERLGLDRTKRTKVEDYYHELEVGRLDSRRVDRRVFGVLAELFGAPVEALRGWAPRSLETEVTVAYRAEPTARPAAAPPKPAPQEGRDEIDELFLGPS